MIPILIGVSQMEKRRPWRRAQVRPNQQFFFPLIPNSFFTQPFPSGSGIAFSDFGE